MRLGLIALLAVVALSACGTPRAVPPAAADGRSCVDGTSAPAGSPSAGPVVPDLALACLSGDGRTSLAHLGKPAVVNLWASWCAPCRTELPGMQAYAERTGGEVLVVGVATGDTREAATSVVTELGLKFPQLYDRDKALLRAVDKSALPVTLFLDAHGRVVYVYNSTALDAPTVSRFVEQYLGVVVGR